MIFLLFTAVVGVGGWCGWCFGHGVDLNEFDQVNCCENDDPDNINKVPVKTGDLYIDGALVGVHFTGKGVKVHADQPENTDCNVDTMGPGQHVEGGPEGAAGKRQVFVYEFGELVHLASQEDQAEENNADCIAAKTFHIAFMHG